MPKPERGLPKSFTIRVPEGPVTLGDYLDEPPAAPPHQQRAAAAEPQPVAPAPPPPPTPPQPQPAVLVVEPAPPPQQPAPQPEPAPAAHAPVAAPQPQPVPYLAPVPVAAKPAAPPRRQFNMSPETLRMLDDLVNHIRMHSAERDLRASELVHALVLAAHEVQPYLDLSKVPARGKWGSATAAALPVALKNIFQEAVARRRSAAATASS